MYYITSPYNSHAIDLWRDDVKHGESHFVKHLKRLNGNPVDNGNPLFTQDPSLRNPTFRQIKEYVIEQSEDLEQLLINATIYAL